MFPHRGLPATSILCVLPLFCLTEVPAQKYVPVLPVVETGSDGRPPADAHPRAAGAATLELRARKQGSDSRRSDWPSAESGVGLGFWFRDLALTPFSVDGDGRPGEIERLIRALC